MYKILNPTFKTPIPYAARLNSEDSSRRWKEPLENVLEASSKKFVYIPFNFLCWDDDILATIAEAKKQDNVDLFILNGSVDWYQLEFYKSRLEIFQSAGLDNVIVLSGHGHHIADRNDQMFYYPVFWMTTQTRSQDLSVKIFEKKKYIFSSLNGIARLHRLILADVILRKPYIDQCCVTFNDIGRISKNLWDQQDTWWFKSEFQNERDKQLLLRVRDLIPYRHAEIADYRWDDHSNLNPAYSDSYINIITETGCREVFFTEKTFKALASGQFVISINGLGSIDCLRQLGFDTFDDIIDHSYDKIQDPYEKIQAVGQLMDDLVTQYWAHLWKLTEERRQRNVQHFFSDAYQNFLKLFEQRINNT